MNEFPKWVTTAMFQAMGDGTKLAYKWIWDALISVLKAHLFIVILAIIFIILIATIRSATGYWGMLGRVIYSLLYFSILFMIGLIWGSDVFANDLFKPLCAVILYPVCYLITGQILNKTGARHRFIK